MEIHNKTMNNVDHSATPIDLKVNIPEKGIFEKKFTFHNYEKVWAAKERVIHEIGKESKDIYNYGFFVPPSQGRAGKFMDEGRPLSEYSLPEDDQSLEFILKRRIYRSIIFDENKLTKIHTKANLKKLMELVEQNNAGQVNQFLEKGLDPNFQDQKTGETPLTAAAAMENATEVIMFLINGGAYLDFRNRSGITPVHKAAAMGNGHNVKAFLDLGASPNYRDLKGLTPLYHACLHGGNPRVAELLLNDQADIGVVDSQGWQEIHQVCRYGHLHHLEQLIFYGADLNAQNGSGNTPLHICALYNQEDCARILLYRGAKRDIVNFANQTAEVVAVVATNVKLSQFIKNYSDKDVVPYIDKPTYSTRRRKQSKSRPTANSVFMRDSGEFIFCSETRSTTSSTSLHSETSEPMSLDLSPRENVPLNQSPVHKSPSRKYKRSRTLSASGSDSSYMTDSGDETGGSAFTTPATSPTNEDVPTPWRTYSLSSLSKEERTAVPRVKEVKGAANMRKPTGKTHSWKMYVAVKDFIPTQAGELSLVQGDHVEVVTKGEKGYWQGSVSGTTGWFPAECVDELKKVKQKSRNSLHKPPSVSSSLNKSNTSLDQSYTPIIAAPQPRQIILHKVKSGFGFQMRGANVPTVNKLEIHPSPKIPALQYVGEVEPGGEADKRGLKKGDYILEVNGNDVKTASHSYVVSLIRKTGPSLIMKVISIDKGEQADKENEIKTKPSGVPRSNDPAVVRPHEDHEKHNPLVMNGTTSGGSVRERKGSKPPVPSRAPTTSLSRPKSSRSSVADVDFEKPQNVQEDRIISVPRERISPTDSEWQSPLTGYQSLPRRPKSSYGAIIGSEHGTYEDATRKHYHPVESLDNTGFMTLPSKPTNKANAPPVISRDDSAVRRRTDRPRSRDRPKSWMPKVLPTAQPTSPPGSSPDQPPPFYLVNSNEEPKPTSKGGEVKKDKKRRFSFKKKKEKDYTPGTSRMNKSIKDEPEAECDVRDDDVTENLQIEDEQSLSNSLPGHHKRLTTFKPVTVPHHHYHAVESDDVSPELSQALEKRKFRALSDHNHEITPVVSPPVVSPLTGDTPVPVFPQSQPPTDAPKSLGDSIKEEMMRRRSNTAPVPGVPAKPRRTFEYMKPPGDQIGEEAEHDDQKGELDVELAKAIAKRAAKLTSEPAKETPIYENIKDIEIAHQLEPRSSVEEPPASSIEEKLKKLHLQEEVRLPTKFKPPVQLPPGKGSSKNVPSGTLPQEAIPPDVNSHGKAPPKTLPKPKKKSSSSVSEDAATNVTRTPRPTSLSLSTEQQMATPPPPVLSPEMVATKFLDDIINEEVKRSNWDTASWKDKSPTSSIDGLPVTSQNDAPAAPLDSTPAASQPVTTTSPVKKKYVYKITLVTEKPTDGEAPAVQHAPVIKQVTSSESTDKTNEARKILLNEEDLPPPPPPPPPLEYDDSTVSLPSPVFTPPSSPLSRLALPTDLPPVAKNSDDVLLETSLPSSEIPPPVISHEPPPAPQQPPSPLLQEPLPPILQEPAPVVEQGPPPSVPEEPSRTLSQESPATASEESSSHVPEEPPTLPQEPPPSVSQEPLPPTVPQELPPPSQELLPPVPQEPPPNVPQESPPSAPEPSPSVIHEPPQSREEPPEAQFSFPLPPPVMPPFTEEVVNGGTDAHQLNDHTEEEEKQDTAHEDVVVPPPVFADGDSEVPNPLPSTKANTLEEKQVDNLEESKESRTLPDQSGSVNDGLEKAVSTEETDGPNESPVTDVPAPPGDMTDQNDDIVEPSATFNGTSEELAPPKPVASDVSTNSTTFREIPYEEWTCVHVCQWLESIGMGEHQKLFEENDIRGPNLSGLTKEDLRELGVKKLGHRMTIADGVHTLTTS